MYRMYRMYRVKKYFYIILFSLNALFQVSSLADREEKQNYQNKSKSFKMDRSSINWNGPSITYYPKDILKRAEGMFKDKGGISTSKFNGAIQTQIRIDLPLNNYGLKTFNFHYSSQNFQNSGFGYGLSLNLESLKQVHDGTWIYLGMPSSSLISTKQKIPTRRIKRALKSVGILKYSIVKAWRSKKLEGQDLFVQIKQNQDDKYFILKIGLNGKSSLFDNDGALNYKIDSYGNIIHYKRVEGILVGIEDSKRTLVEFIYKGQQLMPSYHYGKMAYLHKGIDFIQVLDKKYNFIYNKDDYLLKVFLEGSTRHLFKGQYKKISRSLLKKEEDNLNSLSTEEAIINTKKGNIIIERDKESITLYSDINGDQLDDKIVIFLKNFNDWIDSKLSSLKDKTFGDNRSSWEDYVRRDFLNSIKNYALTVQFYLQNDEGDFIEKTDYRIEFPAYFLYNIRTIISKKSFSLDIKPGKKINLVDINNDGASDLIFCPQDPKRYYSSKTIKRGVEVYQNPMTIAIYDLFHKKKSPEILKSSFGESVVYQQGFSSFNKKELDFKCNQHTVFSDFNKDGVMDALSGYTLYSLKDGGLSLDLTKDQFSSFFEKREKDPRKSPNYLQFYSWYGKLKILPFYQSYYDYKNRQIRLISDRESLVVDHLDVKKGLSKVYTNHGGMIDLKYGIEKSSLLIKEIHYKNRNGKRQQSQYFSYKKPFIYKVLNQLLGFRDVSQEIQTNDHVVIKRYGYLYDKRILSHSEDLYLGVQTEKTNQFSTGDSDDYQKNKYGHKIEEIGKFSILKKGFEEREDSRYGKYRKDQSISLDFESKLIVSRKIHGIKNGEKGFLKTDYSYDLDRYLLKKIQTLIQSGEDRFINGTIYNEKGLVDKKISDLETYKYLYNNKGKIDSVFKDDVKISSWKYINAHTIVSNKLSVDGKEFISIDDFGRVLKIKRDDLIVENKYDKDSFPILQKINGVVQSSLNIKDKENVSLFNKGASLDLKLDSFGRVVKKIQKYPEDRKAVIFDIDIDLNDNVLRQRMPYFKKNEGEKNQQEWSSYNNRGERISVLNDKSEITTIHRENCATTSISRVQQLMFCYNQTYSIEKSVYKDEEIDFSYDYFGRLKTASDYKFKYGVFGNIKRVSLHGKTIFFKSINKDRNNEMYINLNGKIDYHYNVINQLLEYNSPYLSKRLHYKNEQVVRENVLLFEEYSRNIFSYDSRGLLLNTKIGNIYNINKKYDGYGRPIEERFLNNKLSLTWDQGFLTSLEPLVDRIDYSASGNVKKIFLKNKGYVLIERSSTDGSFKQIRYRLGKKDFYFKINLNEVKKITKIDSNYLSTKEIFYDDHNLPILKFLNNKKTKTYNFNKSKNALNYGDKTLIFAYGEDQHLVAIKEGQSIFKIIDENTYIQNNDIVKRVYVGNILIGVFVNETFYPALINHQNALVALINDKGEILFKRDYNLQGELKSEFIADGAKELSDKVLFGYGNLYHLPFIEKSSQLYTSQTRILDTSKGEWLTDDILIIKSPISMVQNPGNWNLKRYASGDPVNFVDSSGYASIFASTGGAVGIAEGPIKAIGYVQEVSSGFVIGTQGNSIDARGFISAGKGNRIAGLAGGAGLNFGMMFGDVDTMGGRGTSHSIVIGLVGFTMYKNGANEFIGVSISPLGKGGGLSEFFTNTNTLVGDGFSFDLGGGNNYHDDGFRFYDTQPDRGNDRFTLGDWSFQ